MSYERFNENILPEHKKNADAEIVLISIQNS
jgi:hypothetical protein